MIVLFLFLIEGSNNMKIEEINIEELTRDIVVELIEKIEVNADGSINIHYRFNNPYSV